MNVHLRATSHSWRFHQHPPARDSPLLRPEHRIALVLAARRVYIRVQPWSTLQTIMTHIIRLAPEVEPGHARRGQRRQVP